MMRYLDQLLGVKMKVRLYLLEKNLNQQLIRIFGKMSQLRKLMERIQQKRRRMINLKMLLIGKMRSLSIEMTLGRLWVARKDLLFMYLILRRTKYMNYKELTCLEMDMFIHHSLSLMRIQRE